MLAGFKDLAVQQLRACCSVCTATLYARLAVMTATGRTVKADDGYRLAGSQMETKGAPQMTHPASSPDRCERLMRLSCYS
jgi:hypothetical protein